MQSLHNTFFCSQNNDIVLVDPPHQEYFVTKKFKDPIPGFLVYAKTEDILEEYRDRANKRPLLVNLHGGPHGSYAPALTTLRYSLLKLGYAVLMPNFPGSTGYGQKYNESALGGIGEKDVRTIIELLDKVLTEN